MNIVPITAMTNKLQGDNVGERWKKGYINQVGMDAYLTVQSISNDDSLKSEIRDRSYYERMIDIYKPLAIQEFEKR